MTRLNHLPLLVTLRRRFGQRLHRTGYFLFGLALNLTFQLVDVALYFVLTSVFGLSPESAQGSGALSAVDRGLGLVPSLANPPFATQEPLMT